VHYRATVSFKGPFVFFFISLFFVSIHGFHFSTLRLEVLDRHHQNVPARVTCQTSVTLPPRLFFFILTCFCFSLSRARARSLPASRGSRIGACCMVAEKTTAFWLGFYQGFTVASQTLRKPIPYFARPLPCAAHSSFRQLSTHTHTHTHSARSSFLKSIHTLSRCHSPTSRRCTLMNEYRYLQTGKAAAAAEALAARTYARTYKCVRACVRVRARACACVRVRARACARIHASHITVMPVAIMPTSLAKLSPLGMVSCGCVYITSARKRQRRTQGARAAAREGGCAAPRFRPHTS